MKAVLTPAALGLAFAVMAAVPAHAFQSELRTPEGGTFAPTGPLEIFIPADVPDDQLARLHIVIDGVDQRMRIEVRGEYAQVTPAEPLSPGAHQLDLVELMPDGTVVSHGSWEFTVAGDASLTSGTVRFAGGATITSGTVATLLSKNDTASDIASSGSADIQGRAVGDGWQVGARLPFVYDTNNQTVGNEVVDIADYLFDARVGSDANHALLNAGHHNIDSTNVLLQNGFARRGLSGRLNMAPMNSNLSVFRMQSSTTSGFRNFAGQNDRNDRVFGIAGSATPVDTAGFGMDMSFSWLDGRDPQLGPATASLEPRREAESFGLSTTLRFLQNTLSVRGDFAHSNFEIPGDPLVRPENGDAYKLAVAWSPANAFTMFGDETRFTLNTDYQRYSTFFTNPANTFDTRDQERYGATAQLAANEWTLGAAFAQAYDNVDDSPLLPRQRGRNAGVEFSFTPAAAQDAEGNVTYGWLGNPTYTLGLAMSDVETVDAPRMGAPGDPTDTLNGEVRAGLDFNKGTWTWGLSYSAIMADNQFLNEYDVSHAAGAQANIAFSSLGLTVAPSIGYQRTNRDGRRASDEALIGNLAMSYTPTNVPVMAGVAFNFARSAMSDDSVDANTYSTSANVGWIAINNTGNWPRLVLSLEGTHQYTDNNAALGTSTEDYVAFVKASLEWARNFGTQ